MPVMYKSIHLEESVKRENIFLGYWKGGKRTEADWGAAELSINHN